VVVLAILETERVLWCGPDGVEEHVAGRGVVRAVHELGFGHFLKRISQQKDKEREK
jgi:hypothetical protein